MEILYRQAVTDDLDAIEQLAQQAVEGMVSQGIDQWDELYPVREDFEQDIQSGHMSLGMFGGEIAVIYTINRECEPEYESAEWKSPDKPYCILHRLCVDPRFQNR
ncbi:MAG: hypothetical protein K2K19_03610 [Acetatifactor sp.]|nr:hypothetical protein [Acetatifactor sp.]